MARVASLIVMMLALGSSVAFAAEGEDSERGSEGRGEEEEEARREKEL